MLQSVSQLQLQVHPPEPGARILYPTEPWESWAVFACNSVVQTHPGDANYSADTAVRMYYDCVEEGTEGHFGQLGWRKTCVAVSPDGLSWTKPSLTIIPYFGQPSNILTNCEWNASDPIRANSVGARASWNRGTRTFSVPDGEVVVAVAFADAELYSLWFEV